MIGWNGSAWGSRTLSAISAIAVLAGCASGPVKLEDKDDTGRFDGEWIAEVDGPRAMREELPGNFYAGCDWEPYTLPFRVSDGMLTRGGAEEQTPVSADGEFKLITPFKKAGIESVDLVYRGTLSDDEGSGRFEQVFTGYGATGCSASMSFDRR